MNQDRYFIQSIIREDREAQKNENQLKTTGHGSKSNCRTLERPDDLPPD